MILWMFEAGIFFIGLGSGLIIWGKISNRKPEDTDEGQKAGRGSAPRGSPTKPEAKE